MPSTNSSGLNNQILLNKQPFKNQPKVLTQPIQTSSIKNIMKNVTVNNINTSTTSTNNITTLNERILNKGNKLTVIQGDITNVVADAIIHPTNNSFYMGGQVGSAIAAKGGIELKTIVSKFHAEHGNLALGGVNITDASKSMLCSKIIHVYSPSWDTMNQGEKINELEKVVESIIVLAETNNLKSIAIPSISSGG